MPPPAPGCASCAARDEEIAGLLAQAAELADLRAQVAGLSELREELRAAEEQVSQLREQVARLERIVSRNSGNSSMPPIADDLPGRKPPRRQRRAAEREEAEARASSPARRGRDVLGPSPDETATTSRRALRVRRGPGRRAGPGGCPVVPAAGDPPRRPQRIQHDLHEAVCGCGRHHVPAARPAGVPDSASVDRAAACVPWRVYLIVFQHVPVERCRELITDAAGAPSRPGSSIPAWQGRRPGRGRDQADPDPDHRRPCRRVR